MPALGGRLERLGETEREERIFGWTTGVPPAASPDVSFSASAGLVCGSSGGGWSGASLGYIEGSAPVARAVDSDFGWVSGDAVSDRGNISSNPWPARLLWLLGRRNVFISENGDSGANGSSTRSGFDCPSPGASRSFPCFPWAFTTGWPMGRSVGARGCTVVKGRGGRWPAPSSSGPPSPFRRLGRRLSLWDLSRRDCGNGLPH
mmetsp:Transcript_122936/g.213217  ORF Transcript_122936/g.213217 Transcript_122936/m.213217 type:complete len:204 (-) Transcript_122936:53-664(-)